ncbi:endonuclease [Flavobacterium sp. GT3R68]|uniref:endonuclease n=1 Tax=Flavobacterium sp. GT3R68 TaxID=2594437 RepID=UPI000F862F74|nr:endonuclease [Flavobacterium sp. GT3R68]RTY86200.1 endonuclease [Flavobacterium sp. GSN2]TRW94020.1 endonuclease [Flavobacterium sp. GT3R68]
MNNYIIYKAQNTFTGETYIGATTKSLEERKIDHLQKSKRIDCADFHEALYTYGSESFTWEQIDTATNLNELAEKETQNIILFNSFQEGYNLNNGGGGFKKLVYQYDIETGELLNCYDDLTSAGHAVNATKKSIGNVCLRIDKTCKGYHWSYSSADKFNSNSDLRKKPVKQISLEGNLIACHVSASDASKKSGVSKTCITRCCREEREQSGGFIWKYS